MTSITARTSLWPTPRFLFSAIFYGCFGQTLDVVVLFIVAFLESVPKLLDYTGLSFRDLTFTTLTGLLSVVMILQALGSMQTTTTDAKWEGHGRVLLFPARTTHSRMFPKRHSFSYSYLVVGIPVGWQGIAGGMVSSRLNTGQNTRSWFSSQHRNHKGWFDIDAADYLERGNGQMGLRGKLDSYLESQVCILLNGDLSRLTDIGGQSCTVPSCVSNYSCKISRVSLQPCLVLVSVHVGHDSCGYDS